MAASNDKEVGLTGAAVQAKAFVIDNLVDEVKPSSHRAIDLLIEPSRHRAIEALSRRAVNGQAVNPSSRQLSSRQAIEWSSHRAIEPLTYQAVEPSSHQAVEQLSH